jgi:hypothetical protein
MTVLILGLTIFLVGFFIHVIIWKLTIPKKQTKSLILIFLITILVFLGLFVAFGRLWNVNTVQFLHSTLLVTTLTLAYITTYSALEVDSPSLVITMYISKADNGLSEDALNNIMPNDLLVVPRINDLVRDNLIRESKGKYQLTQFGARFIGIIIFYRNLLQAKKGG